MLVFAAGTAVLTAILTYMTAATARILRRGPLSYNPLLHPIEVLFRLGLIVVCIALVWWSGFSAAQFGFVPFDVWRDALLGIVLGIVLVWGVNLLSMLLLSDTSAGFYSKHALFSMRPTSATEMAMTVPASLPAAGLEELLFRSMWIGGFSTWVPVPALIVATAILFGVMHVAQGLWGMLVTGVIGLLFGILFVWSESFWLVLITHWVMNLNQFVIAWRRPEFFDLDEVVGESSPSMVDSA